MHEKILIADDEVNIRKTLPFITAHASIDTAAEAMWRGATDYIPKPFKPAQVKLAVDKVSEMRTLEQRVVEDWEKGGR